MLESRHASIGNPRALTVPLVAHDSVKWAHETDHIQAAAVLPCDVRAESIEFSPSTSLKQPRPETP